jgi:transposase-like protein
LKERRFDMTRNVTKFEDLENRVRNLPSASPGAMEDILKGLYAGRSLLGEGGLLTQLIKDLTQVALQGEMAAHLRDQGLEEAGNRRNGVSYKTLKTGGGSFELEVPRDRHSSFEPQLVKKRQTVLNEELDQKI